MPQEGRGRAHHAPALTQARYLSPPLTYIPILKSDNNNTLVLLLLLEILRQES